MTSATSTRPARAYSLAQLTVLSLGPPEIVAVAAQAGYSHAGIRLLPAAPGGTAYPLMNDAAQLRETLAVLRDTGVQVFDLEIIRLGERFEAGDYRAFFEVGQQLGAKAVLVGCDDPDPARLAQSYAALCEAARPYGLTADVEFMPWTAVRNAADAVAVVEAAGRPANAGILVDGIHFGRLHTTLDEIRALPREWLHYAQMCDAVAGTDFSDADLIHTARCERLLPGEGTVDLKGLFEALPADLPVSVEIPHDVRAPQLGALEWARQTLAATRQRLEGDGARCPAP